LSFVVMAFFGFSLLSCHFWPFTGVLRKIFGSLTRKVSETFEDATDYPPSPDSGFDEQRL